MTDWDGYRDGYATMTYAEHRDFYDATAPLHPIQHHFSFDLASEFFFRYTPASVVELGGWDGALAAAILDEYGVRSWLNYEIADVPQVCDDSRYERILPASWAWEKPLRADAFVASHCLEHLSQPHFRALVGALDCKFAYVDVPLGEARDWAGDSSTHVLDISLEAFDRVWLEAGWSIERVGKSHIDVPSHVRFMAHA